MPLHPLSDTIVFTVDTIKAALISGDHSYNEEALYFSEMDDDEVTGTGYTAGGVTLTNKARTYDSATRRRKFDADDPAWSTATISNIKYVCFYKSTGVAATSPILGTMVLDVAQSPAGQDFTVLMSDAGLYTSRCVAYQG